METINLQTPAKVKEITTRFQKDNYQIFIVGGAVRDILMGKAVYDWDFTTDATPEQILTLFPDAFYDNKFGTVGIKADQEGDRPYEITTFRTEAGYSDARRPDKVNWGKTLDEDLKRRDFTINAMALKAISYLKKGKATEESYHAQAQLFDFFDGKKDLKAKLIRAVGDAHERFGEDALRMMRAVRIASEIGFNIEEKTYDAIRANTALIKRIASERVRDELFKILKAPFAYEGVILLRNVGLMEEIIPELEKGFGVEQKSPGRHHIYDVGTHLLMSLKHCQSPDPVTRLATLIHDIGKPQTYKRQTTGTITFYNHEVVSTKIAERIADRLRFSNKQRDKLITLVRYHQFSVDERQTDSAIRRFIRNVGQENIPDMLALRVADRLGGGARETSWRLEEFKRRLLEVQNEPFAIKDLKINGRDVMKILKISSGPKVGEVLNTIFNEVVEKKLANERKPLLKRVKEFI